MDIYGEGYSQCARKLRELPIEKHHKEKYRTGSLLASSLNVVEFEGIDGASPKVIVEIWLSTREKFKEVAIFKLMKMGEVRAAGCASATIDDAFDQPWSSVHSGLYDNLSETLKAKFLSLPER